MKTRIIHTKIYFQDDWFNSLELWQKFLFIYLFTNEHIGMTGIYELSDRVILTETGLNQTQLDASKKKFEKEKRVVFYQGWVCVINSKKYADYSGGKNEVATAKEISMIPKDIFKRLADTLSIPYTYPTDTTINHKSEIINHKSEIRNKKTETIIKKIKEKFPIKKI